MSETESSISTIHTRAGRWFAGWQVRPWEALGIRILFAWVVFTTLPLKGPISGLFKEGSDFGPAGMVYYETQKAETGFAQWEDLTFMSNPDLQPVFWTLCGASLLLLIFGRLLWIALPVLATVSILARTLENSQGFIQHHYQVGASVLTVLAIVSVLAAIRSLWKKVDHVQLNSLLVRYAQITIIGAYAVAGLTKVIASEGEWIKNSPYFGLDLVKTSRQQFYNSVPLMEEHRERKVDPPNLPPGSKELLAYPNFTRVALGAGLALELFCFIGLFNRWLLSLTGIALLVFHIMNEKFAGLSFGLNQQVLWVFMINPVYWIGAAWLYFRDRANRAKSA
ncbi:MAG: hypothetical protein ACI8UO_003271 [Verrucomicrobiales bacterium]|jgi:hypothetical protein